MDQNEVQEPSLKDLARVCVAEFKRVCAQGSRGEVIRMTGIGVTAAGVGAVTLLTPVSVIGEAFIPADKRGLLHTGLIAGGAVLMVVGGHAIAIGQYMVDSENRKRSPNPPAP